MHNVHTTFAGDSLTLVKYFEMFCMWLRAIALPQQATPSWWVVVIIPVAVKCRRCHYACMASWTCVMREHMSFELCAPRARKAYLVRMKSGSETKCQQLYVLIVKYAQIWDRFGWFVFGKNAVLQIAIGRALFYVLRSQWFDHWPLYLNYPLSWLVANCNNFNPRLATVLATIPALVHDRSRLTYSYVIHFSSSVHLISFRAI